MKLKEKQGFNLYQSLFHQSHTGIHLSDKNDKIIDANEAFCKMMGYSRKELLNMSVSDLQAPEVRGIPGEVIINEHQNFGNKSFEAVNISRSGRLIPVNIQISAISTPEGELYFSLIQDITIQKEFEKSLQDTLKEKEVLLRELYHRTKNNMQVVSALLNLQSSYTDNEEVHRTYNDLSNRIQAMALVHQKLYQSKDLSSINISEYIESLIEHLHQSYSQSADRIKIDLDIEDVSFTLETAIPCGLILNEVITNALKYAFPDNKEGIISVKLVSEKDDMARITIKDNGIGMEPDIDTREPKTLGLQLIQTITEYQLQGEMSYRINNGTEWTLEFNKNIISPGV